MSTKFGTQRTNTGNTETQDIANIQNADRKKTSRMRPGQTSNVGANKIESTLSDRTKSMHDFNHTLKNEIGT